MRMIVTAAIGLAFTAGLSNALAAAPAWPTWIDFSRWSDLDEGYRAEFGMCDTRNRFRGVTLNQRVAGRYYYGCSSDPSGVTMLKRLAGRPDLPRGAIAYTSKLSVDLDGSWYACNTPGRTDLCGTSLSVRAADGAMRPVSSDHVPYVAIPVRGPTRILSREFAESTGIGQGDFGIIVTADEVVPVIVADGGPFSKLGEGSIALHRRLGQELCRTKDEQGRCRTIVSRVRSIAGPLVTIIVPGSRRRDVTAANIEGITKSEGERIWAAVRAYVGR